MAEHQIRFDDGAAYERMMGSVGMPQRCQQATYREEKVSADVN
jgi:hypothetical protein